MDRTHTTTQMEQPNYSVSSHKRGKDFRSSSLQIKVRFDRATLLRAEQLQAYLKQAGHPDSLEYLTNIAIEAYYEAAVKQGLITPTGSDD